MRVLATIGFSFSTGVFLAALLPWDGWQLYAAAGAALLALVWLLAARRSTCFRGVAGVFCRVSVSGAASCGAALRHRVALYRHGLRLAAGDGAGL